MRLETDMVNNSSWKNFIRISKHYYEMVDFVNKTENICPQKENVFRFLDSDLNSIKCVILGMDPYPSTYIKDGKELPVATGRAFEVANIDKFTDKYKQQSLANIFKALCFYKFGIKYTMEELRSEDMIAKIKYIKVKDWFDKMEDSGVLFLNATLTTIIGKSGAHIDIWTDFMDELIKYICQNTSCKWLIWGNVALNRVKDIIDKDDIIYSCHPASRQNNNFVEDCCFKKVDNIIWY